MVKQWNSAVDPLEEVVAGGVERHGAVPQRIGRVERALHARMWLYLCKYQRACKEDYNQHQRFTVSRRLSWSYKLQLSTMLGIAESLSPEVMF